MVGHDVLKTRIVIDPNLVIEHENSGLKNRCSPSRFREIAIGNLSLDGEVVCACVTVSREV